MLIAAENKRIAKRPPIAHTDVQKDCSCLLSNCSLQQPLIVLSNDRKFTIPIGMATTITLYGNAYDVLMPGAVMAVVPIVIIYLFAQKTFIAGLTSGAVKG